jgi:hypothetical protein
VSRIRSIKPEFWSSEQVMECSTNARLLFIGLWNFCDDAGRHPLAPKQIKALVFPGDDFSVDDIARMLDELSTSGLITTYTVDGKEYLYVTGWSHQKIDRPQKAKFPAPVDDHSSNPRDGIQRGGDKGKETEANASGASAPPAEIVPIDARTALFREGLLALEGLTGKPEGPARALLGRWLKTNGDDAKSLLATITRAVDARPAEPVAWIEAALKPRDPDAEIYRGVH